MKKIDNKKKNTTDNPQIKRPITTQLSTDDRLKVLANLIIDQLMEKYMGSSQIKRV